MDIVRDDTRTNEELVLRLASAALEMHPNVGTWAIAYYRRVAAILDGFENEGLCVTSRLVVLARVLADTGVDPVLALDAWRLSAGEDHSLEMEIYSQMEVWAAQADYEELLQDSAERDIDERHACGVA